MLPQISAEENIPQVGRKVYINPHFHGQVATALQLQGRVIANAPQSWDRPAIHINPQFLQRQRELQLQQQQQQEKNYQLQQLQQLQLLEQRNFAYLQQIEATPPPAKIISKASTCLVRKQPVKYKPKPTSTVNPQPPLVSISKRKLVRQGASIAKTKATATTTTIASAKRTKYKLVRAISLNTNSSTPLVKKKRSRDFVARYALKRTNDPVTGKKISLISHMLKPSVNKSISMVSIHGVMYKKTSKNKLTKLDASRVSKTAVQPLTNGFSGRTLFVRGSKFVLDPSGCRLTRVQAHSPQRSVNKSLRRRIDIGGLTYVSSPKAQNVFIRTTNHMARAHLMTAKQRSLQLLNRSLVKTNVPCAIFQRLGKCAAYSRGKCRRLHDKRQVAICPSFLRGECTKTNCLLSHNVTLEKMPVCRYFLKGVCVREDCPYLHKKLSRKAEICIDFLRGYCARAADCNMRHEFVCPEFARLGKCELTNCSYCKQIKKVTMRTMPKPKTKAPIPLVQSPSEEVPSSSRYFKCKSDKYLYLEVEDEQEPELQADDADNSSSNGCSLHKRPKLGTLPAFIPLGEK